MQRYYVRRLDGQIIFNDSYVGPIDFPEVKDEVITDLHGLFAGCNIKDGCYLHDFDTSQVTDMESMFERTILPRGFTLGANFDTGNVKTMKRMFSNTRMKEDFVLGHQFDTSKVTNMELMFCNCELPKGFTLGDKFDTRKVRNMYGMFAGCTFPEGFTLGDNFNTCECGDMGSMFNCCVMPEGFKLNDKFVTSKVWNMSFMFTKTAIPRGFKFSPHFSPLSANVMGMFAGATFAPDFRLNHEFDISNSPSAAGIFNGCEYGEGIKTFFDAKAKVAMLREE